MILIILNLFVLSKKIFIKNIIKYIILYPKLNNTNDQIYLATIINLIGNL